PLLAERGFELVLLGPRDLVHLVDEQHHATACVGNGDHDAVRSSLLSQRSRSSSASCIHVPGARVSGGMSVVSRPSNRSGSRIRSGRSPDWMRVASRSHAAPSRTAVIVTTWYDHPLPCAWFRYQSRRASSSFARVGIQPRRNACSNASSWYPATLWVSWRKST